METRHHRVIRLKSPSYALALCLLALCGCAQIPRQCPPPEKPIAPNPDLMQPVPPQGWFRQRLDEILDRTFTPSSTAPTSSPPSVEGSKNSSVVDLF